MHSPGSVAFRIFGLDVMWYGLLIGGGFLLATIISYLRAPKHQIKPDFILDLVIWMIPAAIVGARAYYVIFSWSDYAGDWKKILDIRSGGLAIHGGLILCFLVGYFVCKHYKQGFVRTADLVAVSIPLAQAIGRWGNFFNEEAHGMQTDLPWAQIIDGIGYHPTFLYESIWCFCLFWFLLWFDDHKRSFDGQMISLYMMLYSVERFFVEGLRTDSLMLVPSIGLRVSQLVAGIAVVVGVAAEIYFTHKFKDKPLMVKLAMTADNKAAVNKLSKEKAVIGLMTDTDTELLASSPRKLFVERTEAYNAEVKRTIAESGKTEK